MGIETKRILVANRLTLFSLQTDSNGNLSGTADPLLGKTEWERLMDGNGNINWDRCVSLYDKESGKMEGFFPEPHGIIAGYIYRAHGVPSPNSDSVELIGPDSEPTGFRIGDNLAEGEIGVKYTVGERTVSVGVACPKDGGIYEITLETAIGERRKGYGTACLLGIGNLLLSNGFIPEYRCNKENTASVKTAEAAGFKKYGEFFSAFLTEKKD